MSVSLDEVKHIALLSRLELSGEEAPLYSKQISQILDYAEKLKEIDVENVEPLSHAIPDMKNVFREDEVHPSISNEEALANAPDKEEPYFRVPRVTE